jgi:carbon monoxide dehydrogenase subunit G
MRVAQTREIAAPSQAVWDWISDPERYLHFMSGITRWEIVGEQAQGLGARYKMLMRVGSAEIGGLIEIVEFDPPAELAWASVTGMDQRGRWRVRALDETHTRVELRLTYGIADSGLGGWLAERASAPMVNGNLRRSLNQLERTLRHEQLRNAAAERRRTSAMHV